MPQGFEFLPGKSSFGMAEDQSETHTISLSNIQVVSHPMMILLASSTYR